MIFANYKDDGPVDFNPDPIRVPQSSGGYKEIPKKDPSANILSIFNNIIEYEQFKDTVLQNEKVKNPRIEGIWSTDKDDNLPLVQI